MGILSAAMFFVLSNAKPLEQLSARRPHPNIFCVYVFLSLLGQFAVHLVYLVLVWNTALATMPPVGSTAHATCNSGRRAVSLAQRHPEIIQCPGETVLPAPKLPSRWPSLRRLTPYS